MDNHLNNLYKYVDYVLDTRSFKPVFNGRGITKHALQTAKAIRGEQREPAIIIHGIMPRSGTVYVGELLRLHPDLVAYPNNIWEVPFLQLSDDIRGIQRKFHQGYRHNAGKLGESDFLPLFGASFIAYLYSRVPTEARMLLKVPSVHYLSSFYSVFPCEHLLLLIRDGRDVVHSTLKTWPQLRFSFVCRRWRRSAEMVLECDRRFSQERSGYWLARFEDALQDPVSFVKEACRHFGLDQEKYPFERIEEIRVIGTSSVPSQQEVTWDHLLKPKGFKPKGHWHGWPARKKRVFKRIAGEALEAFGYSQDQSW